MDERSGTHRPPGGSVITDPQPRDSGDRPKRPRSGWAARALSARRGRRALFASLVTAMAVISSTLIGAALAGGTAQAAASGPCDIYAAGGTPCVAAHSTARALYASYNGPLYQVRRASDNATANIGVISPGGVANAAAQDSFCANTSCVITIVYDQSGHGNDLAYQGPGGSGGTDTPSNATSESLTVCRK